MERFVTSCSMHEAFIVSRRFICLVTRVLLGFSFHVNFFLVFPRMVFFPLFPFTLVLPFCLPGNFFFLTNSSSIPIKSFLLLLHFCSLMVDYSQVWLGCPSVSFLLAHLCGLLESVGRKRPGIGLFCRERLSVPLHFACPLPFVPSFGKDCSNFGNVWTRG